jgi:two-component system response regulator HydG
MREIYQLLEDLSDTATTVLVTGPSGTGKELVAKAIHAGSERSEAPLITVNCAALKDSLLESELFGHEKGAFTGAERRRDGKFMQAHTGSIFLDEITEIPLAMQAKLLRVIQEREIERVGGDRPLQVDVRIIAATNRDLTRAVEKGDFREDLYHRLNVFRLDVPPLSAREGDVPVLAQHFLQEYADRNRKRIKGFTPRAMDLLVKYDWPGNVRELENAVERAVILASGEYITPRELPLSLTRQEDGGEENAVVPGGRNLEEVERQAIDATLRRTGGNKSEAARILGITRATLHKKLKRYGIEEP